MVLASKTFPMSIQLQKELEFVKQTRDVGPAQVGDKFFQQLWKNNFFVVMNVNLLSITINFLTNINWIHFKHFFNLPQEGAWTFDDVINEFLVKHNLVYNCYQFQIIRHYQLLLDKKGHVILHFKYQKSPK